MSTALAPVNPSVISAIQNVAQKYNLIALKEQGNIERIFSASEGMRQLQEMLTDELVEQRFMPLMNSQVGFKTDRDPNKDSRRGSYATPVVKTCLIAALMHGVNVVGNEFNIISEQMYITKNGFNRLVREYPGLTNLAMKPGVPNMGEKGALVPYTVSWVLDGVPAMIECKLDQETKVDTRIPVKINAMMGVDAVLGKAERKILARVYAQLVGAGALPEGDVSDLGDEQFNTVDAKKATKASTDGLFDEEPTPLHTLLTAIAAATNAEELNTIEFGIEDKSLYESVKDAIEKRRAELKKKPKQSDLLDRGQQPE